MSGAASLCACRSKGPVIGKCYLCGCLICERCVKFIGGRSVCPTCIKQADGKDLAEVRYGRTLVMDTTPSAMPDDVGATRWLPWRTAWAMLCKGMEKALLLCLVAAIVLHLGWFGSVMDFWSSFAYAEPDARNPLARLTIRLAGRTDMFYLRYNQAIGHYGRYIDRYPEPSSKLATPYFHLGLCLLYQKNYRLAHHYLTLFVTTYPDHPDKPRAQERIEVVKNILERAEGLNKAELLADPAPAPP
jgi:tetratricopeptide (TPR) repeat protein